MRASEAHDCLEEYEFMCDDAIEKAYDVLAPLCAQYGLRPPLPSKFKAAFLWLNHEHGFFSSGTKKQELQAWAMANANTLRARLVYTVRLYRKTPGRSKRPKIQQLKDILRLWENEEAACDQEPDMDDAGEEGEGEQEKEMDETGQDGDGKQEGEMDETGQEGEDELEEEMDESGQAGEGKQEEEMDESGQAGEGVEAQDDQKKPAKPSTVRTSDKAEGEGEVDQKTVAEEEPASKKAKTTKPEEDRAKLTKSLPKLARYR
ncbi:unnamed protein product, partial [Symbiodinium sp. CCMP2456]